MSNGSLPSVSSDIPRDLRNFTDRVRERLHELDKQGYVTRSELDSLLRKLRDEISAIAPRRTELVEKPQKPTDISWLGKVDGIELKWKPAQEQYSGHSFTEVWASDSLTQSQSKLVAQTVSATYTHPVPIRSLATGEALPPPLLSADTSTGSIQLLSTEIAPVNQYFWIRHVNTNNDMGPWSNIISTQTDPNGEYMVPPWVREWINSLGTAIAIINGPTETANSMRAKLRVLQDEVEEEIRKLAEGETNILIPIADGFTSLWALKAASDNNYGAILQLNKVTANSGSANARALYAVTARVGEAEADIIEEREARVDAISATTSVLEGQISQLHQNTNASITQLSQTRATADSALASRITTLDSQVDGRARTIANEEIVSEVSPQGVIGSRLQQVQADIDDTSALVTTLQAAQSGYCVLPGGEIYPGVNATRCGQLGGSWVSKLSMASLLNQVSLSIDGRSGNVSQHLMVHESELDGLRSEWGVTVENNNTVTGISLLNGAGGTAFNVRADRFTVSPYGHAGLPPFYVEGNTTYITNAVIKNLNASNLEPGSISKLEWTRGALYSASRQFLTIVVYVPYGTYSVLPSFAATVTRGTLEDGWTLYHKLRYIFSSSSATYVDETIPLSSSGPFLIGRSNKITMTGSWFKVEVRCCPWGPYTLDIMAFLR